MPIAPDPQQQPQWRGPMQMGEGENSIFIFKDIVKTTLCKI